MANIGSSIGAGLLGGAIVAVGTAIGMGIWYLKTRRPDPLYHLAQTIYLDEDTYTIVQDMEWREGTDWTEGDGQFYESQWWYYTGTGDPPNWWPEVYLQQFN